ncbi:TIGR02530 family flagellar biosynthesis protein [Thalassorhabdus alkalitolerans]|uniref:TIGR02530 family flagellar biosynthesis protein n=1 Tax=Thalassorhabdus alkalitolerans TaxID=2282697 RepID=A0ABW0YL77_9BACI
MSIPIQSYGLHQLPHPQKHIPENNKIETSYFQKLFTEELAGPTSLKISKHADKRLAAREVTISPEQWKKIDEQIKSAKKKGVNESLVLTDKAALIVSAKNETVITAMNRQEANGQIFTNINGTIVL